jgi:bifunctional non-homologous end joining protein LigD
MVNQGTITFHPWLSGIENIDHPDFVLFDLDLGASTTFADLIKIAKELHRELNAEQTENFVKTSGKTGLHVVAEWTKAGGYDEARAWAFSIAERVTETLPKIATLERRKSTRHGRAYVDVMQNAKGHHVVPPYVLRAVPSATVSTPLKWTELTRRLKPERFELNTALKRFEGQKEDPMKTLVGAPARRKQGRSTT